MLSAFTELWQGWLVTIRTVKNRKDLYPPDDCPIRSEPYWTGPKAPELEKQEVESISSVEVVKIEQSEWASPIVFAPKKDG